MKTTVKIVLVIAAFALCSNVSAQTQKLAHINMQELIFSMPEYDSATVKLEKMRKELEDDMELLQVEYRKKLDEYIKNEANLTDLVKSSKQMELQSLQQRIQMFQENAQQQLESENGKLLQPVIEKANKAIEAVAKEQGISYVVSEQVLHFKAVGTIDLLPAVKDYLKIKK